MLRDSEIDSPHGCYLKQELKPMAIGLPAGTRIILRNYSLSRTGSRLSGYGRVENFEMLILCLSLNIRSTKNIFTFYYFILKNNKKNLVLAPLRS